MSAFPLDTDFLALALSGRSAARNRLVELAGSEARLGMSALAWYEFSRGPRTATQLARAEDFLGPEGVIPLSRELSTLAGHVYRALGSPRRRANDIVIGVTSAAMGARGQDDHIALCSSAQRADPPQTDAAWRARQGVRNSRREETKPQ